MQVSGISCSIFLLKPYSKWCVIESLDVFLKLLAAGRNSIWLFSLLFQEFGLDLIFEFQIDVGMVQTYFFKQPYILYWSRQTAIAICRPKRKLPFADGNWIRQKRQCNFMAISRKNSKLHIFLSSFCKIHEKKFN